MTRHENTLFLNKLARFSKTLSRKNLYEFLRTELSRLQDGSRLLNVGSGGEVGRIVDTVCRLKGIQSVSMDVSAERKPDVVCDICEMSFKNEFNAIVMMEVLEHIQNPQLACREICEALRPGGRLIMSTPFIFPLHDCPHDYWRFTRYGLEHLLQEAGFTAINIKERNGWGEALTVLLARVINTPGHPRLARYVVGVIVLLFYPVGLLISSIWPHEFLTTGYTAMAEKFDVADEQ